MRLHLAGCLPQVFESCGLGIQIATPTFATAADAEVLDNEGRTWAGCCVPALSRCRSMRVGCKAE